MIIDVEIPHYNNVVQMLSHMQILSEQLVAKGDDYQSQIEELTYTRSDLEHKLMNSDTVI